MSIKIRFRVDSVAAGKATLKAIQDPTIEESQKATEGDAVGALVIHADTGEAGNLMKIGNEVYVEISQAPKLKLPKVKSDQG
jgi:hypothetical protein